MNEEKLHERPPGSSRKRKGAGILFALFHLLLKLGIAGVIGIILFGYVFGLMRNLSLNMQPAFQDGDLIAYYRIVESYSAGDAVVINYKGKLLAERVIAVAGAKGT